MISLALDTPALAKVYDHRGHRQYTHGRILISDLAIGPGHHVLDIGTGTGLLAEHVADLVGPDGRVVGIDPLPLRIELAKKKARSNLSFQVGRAEDLRAFAPASFDIVYLNSVFHWIAEKQLVLAEIHRVLKPGGRVGFSSASLERPHSVQLIRERALAAAGLSDRSHELATIRHRVSSQHVAELFRTTGFRQLQNEIRTFVDFDANVDDILEFSLSSSFGNDLAVIKEDERARFRAALDAEFEKLREVRGIRQERNLIFAVAERPQS